MVKIAEIQHIENNDSYATVFVLLDDGTEAQVYVGGSCEVYFDHNVIKAFVKRKP